MIIKRCVLLIESVHERCLINEWLTLQSNCAGSAMRERAQNKQERVSARRIKQLSIRALVTKGGGQRKRVVIYII